MRLKNILNIRKSSNKPPFPEIIAGEIYKQRGNITNFYPSDFADLEIEEIGKVQEFTMTSLERLVSLSRAVEYIIENEIPGDFVECGVWKGGSMMLVANKLLALHNTSKTLFLFDTFEGMPAPTEVDISFDNHSAKTIFDNEEKKNIGSNWCYSGLEEVKQNMYSTGYPKDNIRFIPGKVEHTLPCDDIDKIALLRLDTDWYESTRHELDHLYDKLVVGGVLIIDDYGHWSGAKRAVDEFIKERKLKIFLNRVDYTCRLAVKISA